MKKLATLLIIFVSINTEPLIFSQNSLLTLVVSSCGRLDLLEKTLFSFFKCNTYPLKQLIIVDDCFTEREQIMEVIPQKISKFQSNIKIVINKQKMGIVGNVNEGMKLVTTKYMLRSEDDWFYHFRSDYIQDSITLLQESEQKGLNIVQTLIGRTRVKIRKQDLQFTSGGVGYYTNSVIGFNPNIINHEIIFKKIFDGDILSTMRRQHCPDQPETMAFECIREKFYTWAIKKAKPELFAAIVDGDIKQRETTHLGGLRRVGENDTIIQTKIPIIYEQVDGDPLDQNTIIFHEEKINRLYYVEGVQEENNCNSSSFTIIMLISLLCLNAILLGFKIKSIWRAQYFKVPKSESRENQIKERKQCLQTISLKQ